MCIQITKVLILVLEKEKVFFEILVGFRVFVVDHDPIIVDVIKNMCFRCHYFGYYLYLIQLCYYFL